MYTNTAIVLAPLPSLAVPGGSQAPPPVPWTARTPPVRIVENVCDVGGADLAAGARRREAQPFIDSDGYSRAVARPRHTFLAELKKQGTGGGDSLMHNRP